jgi:hypothetical protein
MFVRVYLAPVVQDPNTVDEETGEVYAGMFTTAVEQAARATIGASVSQVIPSWLEGVSKGRPRFAWALTLCGMPTLASHDQFNNLPNVYRWPRITTIGAAMQASITTPTFNGLRDSLTSRGVDTAGLSRANTWRDVLNRAGQHLEPQYLADGWRGTLEATEG